MNVFDLRGKLVDEYARYIRGFLRIDDPYIAKLVQQEFEAGILWPEPLLQFNPSYKIAGSVDDFVKRGKLTRESGQIFRVRKGPNNETGDPMDLRQHQADAIEAAEGGHNYVVTTGTGSGKSLAYMIPVIDHLVRDGPGKGIRAIIVYPMNALANSQKEELKKFLGSNTGGVDIKVALYTGQEDQERKAEILAEKPDILLTNYVMMELILTRHQEQELVDQCGRLQFLVLDELHTYRGRQGADVAMLIRRLKDHLKVPNIQCIGTSATMASGYADPRPKIAEVSTRLFGSTVTKENVIVETLERSTPDLDFAKPAAKSALKNALDATKTAPTTIDAFLASPLSSWIESELVLEFEPTLGKLKRRKPRTLFEPPVPPPGHQPTSAAWLLAQKTGTTHAEARDALIRHLIAGAALYSKAQRPMPFAFRLHQFMSRGGTPYASLEAANTPRYVSLRENTFVPGTNGTKPLYPLAFCRECGEEYYSVRFNHEGEPFRIAPREFFDNRSVETLANGKNRPDWGYAYIPRDPTTSWPDGEQAQLAAVPDEWVEVNKKGEEVIKPGRKKMLPTNHDLNPDGTVGGSTRVTVIRGKFRWCFRCGVTYAVSDKNQSVALLTLEAEARSTATTVLGQAVLRELKALKLGTDVTKVLSFTDNRQDASLQAGHFNDFVEVGILRSALVSAMMKADATGVNLKSLGVQVLAETGLDIGQYASTPPPMSPLVRKRADAAMAALIEFKLHRDLARGVRITSPNLEDVGLLDLQYEMLSAANDEVQQCASAEFRNLQPEERLEVLRSVLDHLRRNLNLAYPAFTPRGWDELVKDIQSNLKFPWTLDKKEDRFEARLAYPFQRPPKGSGYRPPGLYLGPLSALGKYIKRTVFPMQRVSQPDLAAAIRDIFQFLQYLGYLKPETDDTGQTGFLLDPSLFVWKLGAGKAPAPNPLKRPRAASVASVNEYFVQHYGLRASQLRDIRSAEHTAQVANAKRREREEDFRKGALSLLFCSPTMELGVDIRDLLVVNMRNVPPTPANYVQRSGRAGRGGEPAFVYTYCSRFTPHDQYFFHHPIDMVSGIVSPPMVDLTNQDLLRSHLHSIWLEESGVNLGKDLTNLLDTRNLKLPLVESIIAETKRPDLLRRCKERARNMLAPIEADLRDKTSWYSPSWSDRVYDQLEASLNRACERWRQLYNGALKQRDFQNTRLNHTNREVAERAVARHRDAVNQLNLLRNDGDRTESDFYVMRYLATEGFLPGYNFPRLPVTAYIPGRSGKSGDDEYLSRNRFIAINEFGPQSTIYHEGNRYSIFRAAIPLSEEGDAEGLNLQEVKVCTECAYLHQVGEEYNPDVCEGCSHPLPAPKVSLLKLTTVDTVRKKRITSDEEERRRQGFTILTGIRFSTHGLGNQLIRCDLNDRDENLMTLQYGDRADLWRINLSEVRRTNGQEGYLIDVTDGRWENAESAARKNADDDDDDDPVPSEDEEELGERVRRVIPYVNDTTNSLIFKPSPDFLDACIQSSGATVLNERVNALASVQSAIKTAIQVLYHVEEREISAEALPSKEDRRHILLYESAQGGAGVLRNIADDAAAWRNICNRALDLMHFDPKGKDLRPMGSQLACEFACYECLRSYGNQRDHMLLNRHVAKEFFLRTREATPHISVGTRTRNEQLVFLGEKTVSGLERTFLEILNEGNLRLPEDSNVNMDGLYVRPDFHYQRYDTVVFIDGPHHNYANIDQNDKFQEAKLRERGITSVRFKLPKNEADIRKEWKKVILENRSIFGEWQQ